MKKIILFLTLIAVYKLNAQNFEPYVIIDPPNPVEGDVIRVGLQEITISPCFEFPETNIQGLTHLFEFDNNNITLTAIPIFRINICTPVPVSPAPREYYELGTLPVGSYQLKTLIGDKLLPLPIPDQYLPYAWVYGPTINFEVQAQPQAVDSLNKTWLFILTLILLTFTWYFFVKNHPD